MRTFTTTALAMLLAASPAAATEWQTWSPANERFHAELPAGFIVEDSALEEGGTTKNYYSANVVVDGKSYYEASYTLLPAGAIGADADLAEKMLNGGRDNLLKAFPDARLRSDIRMTVNGYPAMDMVIDHLPLKGMLDEKAIGDAQFGLVHNVSVIRQDRLFQANYIGLPDSDTSPDAQRFLKSLSVE